ncbi:hypothetical protein [Morganella morganii]|uniref:hypothetical protein n=1 Tax=Morganella morganii TaxID=582 RepID=UPI00339C530D
MKPLDKLLIKYAKSIVDNINTAVFWVCVFLLIPFILYFSVFNGSLSHQSSDWAAFGSFIGGLVSPILTFITVLVLVANLHESRKVSKINKEMVDIANKTALINKEAAEISKRTVDLAERQFQHNTLDNKIKTAISLTEKLKNYLDEKDYNYTDDIAWLTIERPPIPLLSVNDTYNFYNMCQLWSRYIFESVERDIIVYGVEDNDRDTIKNNYMCGIRDIISPKIPDKLSLFTTIISLINDIETHDYSLAVIPKAMFVSIINSDARYWLYHILIEEQNETLDDYILFQWDDFIAMPKDILAIF